MEYGKNEVRSYPLIDTFSTGNSEYTVKPNPVYYIRINNSDSL